MERRISPSIAACGRTLADLDAGGTALVMLRSESEEDIRDVVSTYVFQGRRADGAAPELAAAGTACSLDVSPWAATMAELTPYGTVKAKGFYGGPSPEDVLAGEHNSLVSRLERWADPGLAGTRHRLLYVPDVTYLGGTRAGAPASAAGAGSPELAQAIALLKRIAVLKRAGHAGLLVVIGARVGDALPTPLAEEAYILDVPYPDDAEVREVIAQAYARARGERRAAEAPINEDNLAGLVKLLRGFRRSRIESVLSLSFARHRDPLAQGAAALVRDIADAKHQMLEGAHGLTWREPHAGEPGGLYDLKSWIEMKRALLRYEGDARSLGVQVPQGLLVSGMPGTGKTYTAEWMAREFDMPLLQLDMGAIQGSLLGESEARFAAALKLVEAMAPCMLFIDELDKAFAGTGGRDSHQSAERILGMFLGWLQDADRRPSTVFVFATANDLSRLPAEFLRLNRFDERFFLFMPSAEELREIVVGHLARYDRMIRWEGASAEGASEQRTAARERDLAEVADALIAEAARTGKYLTGSDVAAVVKETFQQLFVSRVAELPASQRRESTIAPEADMSVWLEDVQLMLARKLEETRMSGETARAKIAWYWRYAYETRPRWASRTSARLLDEDAFDERTGRFSFVAGRPVEVAVGAGDEAYRRALAVIREEVSDDYDAALACDLALWIAVSS